MSDRPIIKIAIDSEEFDTFTAKFEAYREKVKETNAMWADLHDDLRDTTESMAKLSAAATPNGPSRSPRQKAEDVARGKNLKEEEKTWARIERHVGGVSKQVSGLARVTLGLDGNIARLGGGLGIVGAFGALYGAVSSSADSLAARNAQNRSLNLAPGVATAYGKVFQKVGGSEDQLARFETAKMNPDQWGGLLAAGLTVDEIQNDDAETLAETFMQRGSQRFRDTPEAVRGTMMHQTGMSNFASELDMNLASSYTPEQWQKMHADFITQRDKVADNPNDLDAGTDLKAHLAQNWDVIAKAFDHAAITLAPAMTIWSDAATKWLVKFADGVPGAVKKVTDIADKVSPLLPSLGKGSDPLDDAAIDVARQLTDGGKWTKFYDAVKSSHFNSGGTASRPTWNWEHPFGVFNHNANADPAGDATGTDPRHNPGNLRPPGGTGFQNFRTDAEGVRAADRQLQIYNDRDHLDTIDAIVAKWAPKSDHNDPEGYAAMVARRTGFRVDEPLNMKDPAVRARVESAMFQVESNRHRDLTPERVQAMYDPSYKEPKAGAAKADDNARAVKAASDGPQDMTIYAEDDPVLKAHAETHRVLKQIATQKIDPQIIQIDSDGKDSKMPPILERPSGMGSQPANVRLDVRVYAPPGSNAAVTASNFPR